MSSPYKKYLAIREKLAKKDYLFATFSLTSKGKPFSHTAGGVAAESSVGTWTDIGLNTKILWDKLHGRVVEINEKSGIIKIAYPLELFEKGNIPQLLSSIAGNVFGLSEISALRLLDIELPERYVRSFHGPALGIDGIRKLTGITDRPLLGSIIKPKLGLSSKDHAGAALEVFDGGIDLVKDDENLTSQDFNQFNNRVSLITSGMKKKKYIDAKTQKIYCFNITAQYEKMVDRAELVVQEGGNCLMIDILTVGFSSVCGIRNKNYNKMIHAHRAMHAAFTRGKDYGISMLVIAKLARLAGIDSLHTGTVVGKMHGGKEEVLAINGFLCSDWYGLKPVLPVASGGLHPGLMPDLLSILGKNMLFNFGGGVHGHPQGSKAGAQAVVSSLEASLLNIPLKQYAKNNLVLAKALEKWG